MTYLFTDPQPVTGNIGVLNQGQIVTSENPLPVSLASTGNVNLIGNVFIGATVEVSSSPDNPVHVHITEIGTFGNITTYLPVQGNVELGTVSLTALENLNVTVINDNLAVRQSGAWNFSLANANIAVTQAGIWNMGINGIPTVDIRSMPGNAAITVSGNVNISAMPGVTITSGNVSIYSLPNVNIASMPSLTLASNAVTVSGNVGVLNSGVIVSNTNPLPVSGTVEIKNDSGIPINIVLNDGSQLGAFGRLRVSTTTAINEYKTLYGVQTAVGDFLNKFGGAGSGSYNGNESTYSISVGTASGDYAIRQTVQYHPYKPGCGQDVMITGTMAVTKNNLTQRIGYFDDRDGIFFERATDQNGVTTNSWNIRTYAGGSANIAETAAQANWNIDTFGAGALNPSGLTIDWTKAHIWFIDFQWLGVGRVRTGFVMNGLLYYAHEFDHHNNITTTYMSNPTLPVRYEIRNTGNTTGNSSMTVICSAVSSEGGIEDQAWTFCANTAIAGALVSTTERGVLAIRLKNTLGTFNKPNRTAARLINYALFATQSIQYRILHCGSATGVISGTPTWTSAAASSYVEYTSDFNLVSNFIANCIPINSGFVATAQGSASGAANYLVASRKGQIHQNYDSTDSQIIIISAIRIGNQDASVFANMDWLELK